MDCMWANLKNVSLPPFFQVYGNHSQLLCGHDFANERLGLPI